jgi:DNA-binding NarL/FixJ family response regulator
VNQTFRILFVDDEPWLSEALRISMECRGFDCISKTNASAAWQILEKGNVDVVVTDIMMPGGYLFDDVNSEETGFEFIRRIRQRWPRQSIICLSVIADTSKIEALKKKSILYLRKGETPLATAIKLIESKATGKTSFY